MTLPSAFTVEQPRKAGAAVASEPAEDDSESLMYGIGPQGLPLLKPPYGRITAFDMNSGDKLWMVANGDGPRDHPLLKDLHLPPLGTIGRPAPLLTRSLLFVGESSDAVWNGVPGPAKFRAYDKENGAVLWETTLPAGTTGGPLPMKPAASSTSSYPSAARIMGPAGLRLRWMRLGGYLFRQRPAEHLRRRVPPLELLLSTPAQPVKKCNPARRSSKRNARDAMAPSWTGKHRFETKRFASTGMERPHAIYTAVSSVPCRSTIQAVCRNRKRFALPSTA
jgi:hypothetical protein